MRRFIRTFFVKKHAQFSVVQDGEAQAFVIMFWNANETQPQQVGEPFRFLSSDRESKAQARALAVGKARRLAAEAEQGEAYGERRSEPQPEARDAAAAAKAQQLSPAAQEALRSGRRFD